MRRLPPPPVINSDIAINSNAVKSLIKQHRAVVSAVNQTLKSDVNTSFRAASVVPSTATWATNKPPPPPQTYDGKEEGDLRDYDTNLPLEWRSKTRSKDIKKVHEEANKITHANTLVDILHTISDLRDDIEKIKKDKRHIITALRKLEKQKKVNNLDEKSLVKHFAVKVGENVRASASEKSLASPLIITSQITIKMSLFVGPNPIGAITCGKEKY